MNNMSQKLTILIAPCDAIGTFNPSIGIAQQLHDRGHKVIFAVPDNWKQKLSPQGFIEEWYNDIPIDENINELQSWGNIIQQMAPTFIMTPEQQIKHSHLNLYGEVCRQAKEYDLKLIEIVKKIKPDIILIDNVFHQPAIRDSGIPWVFIVSFNPLGNSSKNVAPAFSGYPSHESNKKSWDNYIDIYKNIFQDFFNNFKDWVISNGGPELKFYPPPYFMKYSPYANIYMYPKEIDYTEYRSNPSNFYQFDNFMRNSNEIFEIPEQLKNKSGKIIYFSMGTIGCCELEMMRRLISILGKCPHRFIISKGPLGDQIDLPDNMWGSTFLPQTKVIPLVDLVICHGGNNTITETFYFGKPLIVLPLFADQLDNAQRIKETGLGYRFHPYTVTEFELNSAIENLLSDEDILKRMTDISKRIIHDNNGPSKAADLIEKIALENYKK